MSNIDETLLTTYGRYIGNIGTCLTAFQIENAEMLRFVKKHFNSITMENEMKPDSVLGKKPALVAVSDAEKYNYIIPYGYDEEYMPLLDFSVTDRAMKICSENKFKLRIHTLVWHSQTPDWFFKEKYSESEDSPYVSADVMDSRLEFYIRNFMAHIYSSPYSDIVTSWDVVNEYPHAEKSGWESVYGNQGLEPAFVKRAYEVADETLKEYGVRETTALVFNDYNTYEVSGKILSVLDYVNNEGRLCDTIGMQAHLDTEYPSSELFAKTLCKFSKAGYRVQITELDATCKDRDEEKQSGYYYNLFTAILKAKKSGADIESLTFWGPSDESSWRGKDIPLLFSSPDKPKAAYYSTIKAFYDNE